MRNWRLYGEREADRRFLANAMMTAFCLGTVFGAFLVWHMQK